MLRLVLLAVITLCSMTAHAGLDEGAAKSKYDEGLAAYNKKDYATALDKWHDIVVDADSDEQKRSAIKKIEQLAEKGYVLAQYKLGSLYEDHDNEKALKWTRLAAEHGYVIAQNDLAVMYGDGRIVQKDDKEAVKWLRLAAAQGNSLAQFNLGMNYVKGEGVLQSRVIAYALYSVAATQDPSYRRPPFDVNRKNLSSSMTAAEINAGQSLSRDMSKPKNLLKALDKYSNHPIVDEKLSAASDGAELSHPAK
jgi:TPR repeat protein